MNNDGLWTLSIAVIILTLVFSGTDLVGLRMPDSIIRLMGILRLLTLPVLAYTTVQKIRKK